MPGSPSASPGQRLAQLVLDELEARFLVGRYPVGSGISIEQVKAEFIMSGNMWSNLVRAVWLSSPPNRLIRDQSGIAGLA
ncbi:MAG: hypothetical protein LBV34_28720 [Nocardiopsaceae bacterium]|jgi:hypothetical protein|nr:hypothetical protein [Nocardiopsaceae bacterium]